MSPHPAPTATGAVPALTPTHQAGAAMLADLGAIDYGCPDGLAIDETLGTGE